jgi:hypothetical protein
VNLLSFYTRRPVTYVLTALDVGAVDAERPLHLEGRRAGVMGWLVAALRIGGRIRLTATQTELHVHMATLAGPHRIVTPLGRVDAAEASFRRSVGALVVGGAALLLAAASAVGWAGLPSAVAGAARGGAVFLLLIAAGAGLVYVLKKRLALVVGTAGGRRVALGFKRAVVGGLAVDRAGAEDVAALLLALVARADAAVGAPLDDATREAFVAGAWAPPPAPVSALRAPLTPAAPPGERDRAAEFDRADPRRRPWYSRPTPARSRPRCARRSRRRAPRCPRPRCPHWRSKPSRRPFP